MTVDLSEEAFSLLDGLREELVKCQEMLESEPAEARAVLSEAINNLSDWIGPGAP
jgi:hypothetical protein